MARSAGSSSTTRTCFNRCSTGADLLGSVGAVSFSGPRASFGQSPVANGDGSCLIAELSLRPCQSGGCETGPPHGSVLGGKTRRARVSPQWKSTGNALIRLMSAFAVAGMSWCENLVPHLAQRCRGVTIATSRRARRREREQTSFFPYPSSRLLQLVETPRIG